MHDFLLAKEIVDKVLEIMEEKGLKEIVKVQIEIGEIALAHDDFPEHIEDINLENLEFGLKSIAEKTVLKEVEFELKKTEGENWKIVDIIVK